MASHSRSAWAVATLLGRLLETAYAKGQLVKEDVKQDVRSGIESGKAQAAEAKADLGTT